MGTHRVHRHLEELLRDWRPAVASEMASLAPEPARTAGELVAAAFARFKLSDRLSEAAVMKAWAEAAGPLHARHTRPRAFRDGILIVSVSNSALLSELRTYSKKLILQRLRDRLGAVKLRDIAFRMDG
jgi:predicted nucleic acid-binding Zn ribbon protein